MKQPRLTLDEILRWLREEDPAALETLWQRANAARQANVGDAVHLRGLVEISNHCMRQCGYCGLRAGNTELARYRMSADEIVACAATAVQLGYGTVVLQAGEDPQLTAEWIADVVRRIKAQTSLAVTLSLGERTRRELLLWRRAGADRYLLRFETSCMELYQIIHPPAGGRTRNRIDMLYDLKSLDYEVGSGIMIGIPGQTWDDLAKDILLFGELDLDMIGVGPYLPHPGTPLGQGQAPWMRQICAEDQVPNSELMVYKVIALTRLVRPDANIPSTTALATINKRNGRELGLKRGANVVMPNVTPVKYRAMYEIYPSKACIAETADACQNCIRARISMIGREIGAGPGGRGSSSAPANEIDDCPADCAHLPERADHG